VVKTGNCKAKGHERAYQPENLGGGKKPDIVVKLKVSGVKNRARTAKSGKGGGRKTAPRKLIGEPRGAEKGEKKLVGVGKVFNRTANRVGHAMQKRGSTHLKLGTTNRAEKKHSNLGGGSGQAGNRT